MRYGSLTKSGGCLFQQLAIQESKRLRNLATQLRKTFDFCPADAELLRLGRRLAVCDIRIWTESPERLAAQANVTYAIPG